MATLKYDNGIINYILIRRKGMKNIRIRIKPDGSVNVSADTSVALTQIEKVMFEKLNWILESKKNVIALLENSEELSLKNGSIIRILGEYFELEIIPDKQTAKIYILDNTENKKIVLEASEPISQAAIEMQILQLIAEKGRKKAKNYLTTYLEKSCFKGKPPSLSLKMLKSRWGHFNSRNNEIMLNYSLAGLPLHLFEYVAVHEVCHIFINNHSADFYALGEKLLKGFKSFDRELNKYSIDLWRNIIING